jgi:uncharacterized protein (TIGR02246 family)
MPLRKGGLTVTTKRFQFLAGGLAAVLAIGVLSARDDPASAPKPAAADQEREADTEAIRATARAFAAAFNKGDAKAVAAQWTEYGECADADGELIRGRANIEKAFAEFFKANPRAKVQVLVGSIRFPAPDLALEEGVLRQVNTVKDLPTSTLYSATHVRTDGKWQTAVSREWGAGQDRLENLDWLVGQWSATLTDQTVTLTFTRDGQKPFILGRFTKTAGDKTVSTGTMRIGLDPQTGQLRSWHFDEDGGHGQSLWVRDGNRWVLDCVGVMGDGAETASVNVLGRLNNDEITWQSIDRVMGDQALPDTVPIRLTRVPPAK